MRFLRSIVAAFLIFSIVPAGDGVRAQSGLDATLKPGAHLLLALDLAEVRAQWLIALRDEARARLRDAKVGFAGLGVADNGVRVRLATPDDAAAALKALAGLAPAPVNASSFQRLLGLSSGSPGSEVKVTHDEAGSITITQTEAGLARRANGALDDVVGIFDRRLDGMGIKGTAIRHGGERIHVHVPAVETTAALKALLTKPARLGFYEVHETFNADQARQTRAPLGFKVYAAPPGELVLRESPALRGNDLVDAQTIIDQRSNDPVVVFRFNATGARLLARLTAQSVGRPFAIVLDDVVLSAPIIREPILGGSGQVSGNFTFESAQQLAVQLRAGALPAKVTVVEERLVPSGR